MIAIALPKRITVWNIETEQLISTLTADFYLTRKFDWSPDSSMIVGLEANYCETYGDEIFKINLVF